MKKLIVIWVGVLVFFIEASTNLMAGQKYSVPSRDPCTDPSAYCRTESNGSRWCGFKGETIRMCSPPRPTSRSGPRKSEPAQIGPVKKEADAERRARLQQECRDKVIRERAEQHPGKLSGLIDATKLASCMVIK